MTQFDDYSWIEERSQELEQELSTWDVNSQTLLNPNWQGVYRIRVLPIPKGAKEDFLRPVGYHWNVIPGDADNKGFRFGCPKFTWHGEECPVCNAMDKAIAERRATPETFKGKEGGKGRLYANKQLLLRVLLLDYEPLPEERKPPKFRDLPQLKIMAIPTTMGKELRDKLLDTKDFGPDSILHPQNGQIIKLTKSEKKQGWWSMDVLSKPYPIPEQYLDVDTWPLIEDKNPTEDQNGELVYADFLPRDNADSIRRLIGKYERDVMPIIANYVLSLDAGAQVKQLEAVTKAKKVNIKDLQQALDAV